MAELPPRIVLFDGDCAVCDATVQFLMDRDRDGRLAYAPLQGETAAAIRARHPEWPEGLDSLVYVEQRAGGERISWYTTGVLRMVGELPAPWSWVRALLWVPRFLRDPFYRLFAAVRFRIFGHVEQCRMPSEDEVGRLLA